MNRTTGAVRVPPERLSEIARRPINPVGFVGVGPAKYRSDRTTSKRISNTKLPPKRFIESLTVLLALSYIPYDGDRSL